MASSVRFQQTADTLSELSSACEDSHDGFLAAARKVENPDLQRLFNEYAGKRLRYRMELQEFVASLGIMPRSSARMGTALRRMWITALEKLTGASDHAILSELERGEDATTAAYQEAFSVDLIDDAKTLIQRQYAEIKETHDRIRTLRDRYQT